jgi:hypothetical protein
MRRGLHLLRELDDPESTPDFSLRLHTGFLDLQHRIANQAAEYSRAAAVAALTVVSLLVVASLTLGPGGDLQLPPVVVESTANAEPLPSLWGPAPRFTPSASLLQIPNLDSEPFLSLFRAPLRTPPVAGDSRSQEAAPE